MSSTLLSKKGKVLGVDYGTRRVGVASGDLEIGIAFPRTVLENRGIDFVVARLAEICVELEVKVVVVGLPLNMKIEHGENKIMGELRKFVEKIKKSLKNIEVVLFDERLSTFEAGELMDKYQLTGPDDLYAAQIVLQRFFEGLKKNGS